MGCVPLRVFPPRVVSYFRWEAGFGEGTAGGELGEVVIFGGFGGRPEYGVFDPAGNPAGAFQRIFRKGGIEVLPFLDAGGVFGF